MILSGNSNVQWWMQSIHIRPLIIDKQQKLQIFTRSLTTPGGSMLWVNQSILIEAYTKSQLSDKLNARRFCPFNVFELVGRNAVYLEFPAHSRFHSVLHVIHTTQYTEQLLDIFCPMPPMSKPVPSIIGEEHVGKKILNHRPRGLRFQFLTSMKGCPTHDAAWQQKKRFHCCRRNSVITVAGIH